MLKATNRSRLRDQEKDYQIVDVRSPDEWDEGHIPDAEHIFLPQLEKKARS
jgi:rhodanese-related sulfurtransferase